MSPSLLSPNRVSEVLKDDLSDLDGEPLEAVETANSMTTSMTEEWTDDPLAKSTATSLVEDWTQEETTDPSVTAISPPSQKFETEADQLYDYNLNQVPPELSGLQPSDFLQDPDEMNNIVFVPKHILARICEMLSPKEFGALAQTCRYMHWRMMKWGRCSVKELTVEVRQNGTRGNGEPRIEMSPKMAYDVFRKHIQFQHINLRIVVPATGASAPLFKKMAEIFRSRENIKYLEVTASRAPPLAICETGDDFRWERNMLRDVHAGRFYIVMNELVGEKTVISNRVEHDIIPPIYDEQQAIVIREPDEIYLMTVPIDHIDTLMRYFLDVDASQISYHSYPFAEEDREKLAKRLDVIIEWAATTKDLECYRWRQEEYPFDAYGFYRRPSPKTKQVLLFDDMLLVTQGKVTYPG